MNAQLLPRKRYYTLLQVANGELSRSLDGWHERAYRDLLATHGATEHNGRVSASTMSTQQLDNALEAMKALGFKPRPPNGRKQRRQPGRGKSKHDWRAARIAKLNAMWIGLADAGVVFDRSEKAMNSWCENQVQGLTRLAWATTDQLNQAIEKMKKMAQQRGLDPDHIRSDDHA